MIQLLNAIIQEERERQEFVVEEPVNIVMDIEKGKKGKHQRTKIKTTNSKVV